MGARVIVALVLSLSLAGPAAAGEAIAVVQENRTRELGKKTVHHVAILKNRSDRPVRGLRVTVELYDYFGAILWARAAVPVPASLGPGETATLSLTTPDLAAHRRTAYRFEYRPR